MHFINIFAYTKFDAQKLKTHFYLAHERVAYQLMQLMQTSLVKKGVHMYAT